MATLAEKYKDIRYCAFDGKAFCVPTFEATIIDLEPAVIEEWWVAPVTDEKDPTQIYDTNVITIDPAHLNRAPNPHVKHFTKPVTIVISEDKRHFCALSESQAQEMKTKLGLDA